MHILVTGGAGYIGSRLVPILIERGHQVTVVDTLLFGNYLTTVPCRLIQADIVDFNPTWLDGVDAVIHLAAVSNDPMAAFRPSLNFITNTAGTALLVFLCKAAGVERFIHASTCSIYGYSMLHDMDEDSAVEPSFPYGVSKLLAEMAVLQAQDDTFRPICLRKGTLFGWAPRMRFDLVVNTMTKYGLEGKIAVHSPDLWRPLVHIEDVCRAYVLAVEKPDVTGVFNVVQGNYTILDIAEEVASTLRAHGHPAEIEVHDQVDVRNYRASFGKARDVLGFRARRSIAFGVEEILSKVDPGDYDNPLWINHVVHRRVVEQDEAEYALWRGFIEQYGELAHLGSTQWPQEGP